MNISEKWLEILNYGYMDDKRVFIVGSWAVHLVTFWGWNILLAICYYFNLFPERRIQGGVNPDWKLTKDCIIHLLTNHLLVQPIALFFLYNAFEYRGTVIRGPLPSAGIILRDLLVSVLMNDTLFYWAHRMLHHKSIYKYIHKQHHKFKVTIGIACEYAHPVEDVLSNVIPTLSGPLLMGSHVLVFWLWLSIALTFTIDAHSGYYFLISPFNKLPFQVGSDRHDYHHSHNVGCYGAAFVFWDWIMGTDKHFLEYDQKKKSGQSVESLGPDSEVDEDDLKKESEGVPVCQEVKKPKTEKKKTKMKRLFMTFMVLLPAVVLGDKSVCSHNRHKTGSWKHRQHLVHGKKSFHCCGWDNSDFLHDKALCGETKIGGINDLYVGNDMFPTQTGGNACDCDAAYGRYSVNPREQYEWVPEFCVLQPWNATEFCDLLGNRTILLSGDSTMQQTASTIMSMVTVGGGKCAKQLSMGRSDELFFSLHGHKNFFQYVEALKPDIAILNAGAHLHDIGDIYSVWENIKSKMDYLRTVSPKTTYVWKTQNPGHVDCQSFKEPLKELSTEVDKSLDFYQYNLFRQYDEISYNYSHQLNYKVIDMSPLYYRPDSHADCMHYCVPGPIDIFSNILLGMLVNKEL